MAVVEALILRGCYNFYKCLLNRVLVVEALTLRGCYNIGFE